KYHVADEGTIAVQPRDVGAQLTIRQRARQPRGAERIRCAPQRLPWRKRGVNGGAAVGAHRHFEPARRAVQHGCSEVERGGEQAVGHRNWLVRQSRSHLAAAELSVIEDEPQAVVAVGGHAAVVEGALVGEGGAPANGNYSLRFIL